MKRTILLLMMLFLLAGTAMAQISGNGSLASPYHGINPGNFTISGTKYFDGNLGVSSGTLTLMPGTRLISISRYACIVISGSGQLNAQGTSARPILLSADIDTDNIFGEPTDFWGNIYLTSTASSIIDYCTIENGQRTRLRFLGGAIYVGSPTVTINHTTIRNCLAYKGGGIYAETGSVLNVSNTLFLNNSASDHGGAIFIAEGSSPVISNCVFRNNKSLSTLLKGGTIASLSGAPVIVNSTIAYSTSPASDGKSIYLENSPNARIVNSVIWGGSSHIGLSGTPSSVFAFCAIEGVDFTGCLNLNSSNTAPDGPNFTNPAGGNFNLEFISPCRDMGADSYTGVTIPPTDFIGSGRVGITDMGAYEMIYSRWRGGTSDWASAANWDGGFLPGTRNIIIPSGKSSYPVTAPGPAFTLNAGLKMIMEPGAQATFSSLTNNGALDIQSDASGIASLLTGSFSGTGGTATVRLFLTGAPPDIDRWHYIAPPVTVPKTVFINIEPDNLLSYDESKVTTDVIQGWQWHDGYDGTTPFTNLEAKKGYDVLVFNDTTVVFSGLTSLTTSMGQINLPFSGSGGDTSLYGYSLVGNSLTCGMNWDQVTQSDSHVRDGIYLIQDGVDVSYVDGVGTNGGSAHIPPLQGFFVKTRATGTYITIPDNAREHNATPRYKSAQIIPLIRLTLISPKSEDEMVVRLESMATNDFDNEYDAGKMFVIGSKRALIYSVMNRENYSINSIPWPETKTIIPLTLKIPEEGTYKIKRSQLQGTGNSKVTLVDMVAGKSVDLLAYSEYTFSAPAGTVEGRFTLTVSANKVTVPKKQDVESSLQIYSSSGKVCVLPRGNEWDNVPGKVKIYDITGRLIMAGNEEWFNSGEVKEYSLPGAGGMLIVELKTGAKRYLQKVVLAID
jgi:predicted outer membrane repeat protein